jgi:AbrB family looped-hinge helix DNA binding protein
MGESIQVSLDGQGRIVIPSSIRKQLGLLSGVKLLVEAKKDGQLELRVAPDSPVLADKNGVLVVQSEATSDITAFVENERHRRAEEIATRVGP